MWIKPENKKTKPTTQHDHDKVNEPKIKQNKNTNKITDKPSQHTSHHTVCHQGKYQMSGRRQPDQNMLKNTKQQHQSLQKHQHTQSACLQLAIRLSTRLVRRARIQCQKAKRSWIDRDNRQKQFVMSILIRIISKHDRPAQICKIIGYSKKKHTKVKKRAQGTKNKSQKWLRK